MKSVYFYVIRAMTLPSFLMYFLFSYIQLHRGVAARLYVQKPLRLAGRHGGSAWSRRQDHLWSTVECRGQRLAADLCSHST